MNEENTNADTTGSADLGDKPLATVEEPKPKRQRKPRDPNAPPRPRLHKYAEAAVITILKPDAKLRKAKERFGQYRSGMTVKEYLDTMAAEPFKRTPGQTMADLRWDVRDDHKFIQIIEPELPPTPLEEAVAAAA